MKNKKIVLLYLDFLYDIQKRHPSENLHFFDSNSLTLACLAAMLTEYEVVVIESAKALISYYRNKIPMSEKDYLEKIISIVEKEDPSIILISALSSNLPISLVFSRIFKARNPDVKIIFGGVPATFIPEKIFEIEPTIDFIVRGEGELTIKELVDCLFNTKSFNKVKGISFRNKEGKIVSTPNRELIKNLDELPIPDYSFYRDLGKIFYLEHSRGCNFNCTFCSNKNMWGCERLKSVDRFIDEINHIREFGFNSLFLYSNNFTTNKKWIEKFCEKMPSDITWHIMTRIDMVNETILKKFSRCGCESILYGVESVSSRILKYIDKTNDFHKWINLAKEIPILTIKAGIVPRVHVVIGFPNERKEDVEMTLTYIRNLVDNYENLEAHVGRLRLYPGIRLWEMYENKKIELIFDRRSPWGDVGNILFAKDYLHLPWLMPYAWVVKNKYISPEEFNKIVFKYQNEKGDLFWLAKTNK